MLSVFGAQLKSLKFNISTTYKNERQLMEFLYTQKRLETLALRFINSSTTVFAKKQDAEYHFKLKQLSLRKIVSGISEDNLIDFLHTQKDSVEVLELGTTFSDDIYVLVLNEFNKLKTLVIDISGYPDNLNFYKRIKVNKNVTELVLVGENEDTVKYCTLLSLLPNVTDFRFQTQIPFEVLSFLPKYFNALASLSLHSLSSGNYKNVKFPALKNFHLDLTEELEEKIEWFDLVMSNPTTESLSFERFHRYSNIKPHQTFDEALKIVCAGLPNLKHLKIGFDMHENMKDLQEIVDMSKSLLSIDIFNDDKEPRIMSMRSGFQFCCHDRSSIRYVFPRHGPIWKGDIDENESDNHYRIQDLSDEDLYYETDTASDTEDDDDLLDYYFSEDDYIDLDDF